MAYVDFQKLKARVSITDILEHYGLLTGMEETKQGHQGSCPFCGKKSLKVNTEKNAWFCFGDCKSGGGKAGGNMLDFVMQKEGDEVLEAARRVIRWFPEEGPAQPEDTKAKPKVPRKTVAEKKEREGEGEAQTAALVPGALAPDEGEDVVLDTSEAAVPVATDEGDAVVPDTGEPESGAVNKPLTFTLKSIDYDHPALKGLGVERKTLKEFGAGYFTGKGSMHNRIVIPIHNRDGLLVAYAGYSPTDKSYKYPAKDKFDPRLELYNVWRASNTGASENGVVIVTDFLNVLRLYDLGIKRVVAMPTEKLYAPQLAVIEALVGEGGGIDYAPWTKEYVETLATLVTRFHVRLHRYYEGSEDEFLSQVVSSIKNGIG